MQIDTQHRMGADLDERAKPPIEQTLDGAFELNGLAHVATPVIGAQLRTVQRRRRDGRVQRDVSRLGRDPVQRLQQLIAEHINLRRVPGRDPTANLASAHILLCAYRVKLCQRLPLTREHKRTGPVDDRHPEPPLPPLEQLLHTRARTLHRQNRALSDQRGEQATA